MTNEVKRNKELDRRANALKLKPSRPNLKSPWRSFIIDPPLTEADRVDIDRITRCKSAAIRGRFVSKDS